MPPCGCLSFTSVRYDGKYGFLFKSPNPPLIAIVSATFLSRHAPIWEFPPYRSRLFVTISLGVLALQSVFFAISLSPTKDIAESVSLSMIPGYAYGIAFAASVLVLLCQEIAKLRDRTAFRHFQRKAKLVFDTKLGMHSPV